MRTKIAIALLLAPTLALQASNVFFVSANVQSQVDALGHGADACQYAGVTLLRELITGQAAEQLAGPTAGDPTRIYTKPGQGSFFLTDVGSQWTGTVVGQNQAVLAFLETTPGDHSWTGAAYAGASRAVVSRPDLSAGKLEMPAVLMTRLPSAVLVQAGPASIHLQVPGSVDVSGLGHGLRLWRHRSDLSGDPWQTVVDLPWSTTAQDVTDTGVTANLPYIYGISYIYNWIGGGGVGADPAAAEEYITNSRGLSNIIYSSSVQPTPTPFPTLPPAPPTPNVGAETWVAYPNPLIGSELRLAFKTTQDSSQYQVTVYALDGTLVLTSSGKAAVHGWQKPIIDLGKLASGVYLVRMRLLEPGVDEQILPVRKLAIIK
jgi:hypothetical protein